MFNLFKPRPRYWITPGGKYWELFADMAQQPHLLIAGATGSGKSVVINGIIGTIIRRCSPSKAQFILIDPKRVELKKYQNLPHVIRYADTQQTMLDALEYAKQITDNRFVKMQRNGVNDYNGSDVYVIIDELAALMTTQKREVLPLLQYLGIIARAAHVHVIAATQTVKATVLPTTLTCNFDARVALRTATAQQSRMIIDVSGCELLPSPVITHSAQCYFRQGADLVKYNVPMLSKDELDSLCSWWTGGDCVA